MQKIELKIEKIALGGAGLGYHEGQVVFVHGTIPGETVEVKIIKEKKNHLVGKLLKLITPSPERIEPTCPFANRIPKLLGPSTPICPGCSYQHLAYHDELKYKHQQFCETLTKLADIDTPKVKPAIASPSELHYRNKMTLNAVKDETGTYAGYFMEDNLTILDIPECPLVNQAINDFYKEQRQQPGFLHTLKDKMKLTYRCTENDGVLFWRNTPPKGLSWLKEETSIGTISVPAESFFQVNPGCANYLMDEVAKLTKQLNPEQVIDLFCGVGVFSIAASLNSNAKVIGIDSDQAAIQTASYNAKQHRLKNCEFRATNAFKNFKVFDSVNPEKTLLITDPPRSGMSQGLTRAIGESKITDIIYISCAPDTLARDLSILLDYGYELRYSQMVDMFPRTAHFESISYLQFCQ